MLTRRTILAATPALAFATSSARAQAPTIRIGALQDASGNASYLGGVGSIACARQAIAEMAGRHGLNIELVTADHQNKPDVGSTIARQWLDSGVDVLLEFNNSAIALAVSTLVKDRDKVMLANNVGSAALSGPFCTPNMTHWTFDTAMLARVMGNALFDKGGKTWFFIRADYVFGKSLRDDTAAIVEARGGKVVGDAALPVGTQDYAAALLQAQSSGADVVAFALSGHDLQTCVKQAAEMGVGRTGKQRLGALIMYLQDVKSLGPETAQGLQMTESFYWNLNDRSRNFSKRITPHTGGVPPNMGQAGAYSAVYHYLKAVASLGATAAKASGRAAVARMKELPIEDEVLNNGSIRADGRVVSDVYLFGVKSPAESQGPWDLYNLQATLGPNVAWRPMSEGGCKMATG